MNQNKQSSSLHQWDTAPQPYPTLTDDPQNAYTSSASMPPIHGTSPPTSLNTTYHNNTQSHPQYSAYYNTPSNYPPSSPGNNQQMYPSPNVPINYAATPYQTIPCPTQSPVHQTGYPHAYPYPQSSSMSNPPMGRSHPHAQAYGFPSNDLAEPQYTIPIPQTIGISSDYSTSPGRPYSCDLCALSFNRQHDLKRHRETHTGEKPYLCNGGCGKTFTRKDALKRHQV